MLGTWGRKAIIWVYLAVVGLALVGLDPVLGVPIWVTCLTVAVAMGLLALVPGIERALGVRVLWPAGDEPDPEPSDSGGRGRKAIVWAYLVLVVYLLGLSAAFGFRVPIWVTLA